MRTEHSFRLITAVMDVVKNGKIPITVTKRNIKIAFPSLLSDEQPTEWKLTDHLALADPGPIHKVVETYEQLVWWKLNKEKLDKATAGQIADGVLDTVGRPLSRLLLKSRDGKQAVLAYVWGLSKVHGTELVLDQRNCWTQVGPHVFGVVDGVIRSSFLKDVRIESCRKVLDQTWSVSIRDSPQFIALLIASRHELDTVRMLNIAVFTLGVPTINSIFDAYQVGSDKALPPWMYKKISDWIADEDVHPLDKMRSLLIPQYMSKSLFISLFGLVNKYRLPGVIKRRRLQKTINTLFSVESEKNDET